MGTVLGNLDMPKLKDILDFKESLSVLLISILFIILAAHINLGDLNLLKDWRCFVLLAIILLLRPLGVLVSTRGGELSLNEKMFISLIGPRGIVAAGIASLFGLRLVGEQVAGAEYITPLVFMVVLGTVLMSAIGARPFAKLFGVLEKRHNGVLIIGADRPARLLGAFFKDQGRRVVMVDMNASNLNRASEEDIEVFKADIYQDDLKELIDLQNMEYLLAMTGSGGVNRYAWTNYAYNFAGENLFAVQQYSEDGTTEENRAQTIAPYADHIDLMEVARDHPQIHLMNFTNKGELEEIIRRMKSSVGSIPLCIWTSDSELKPLVDPEKNLTSIEIGSIIYLGKTVSLAKTSQP